MSDDDRVRGQVEPPTEEIADVHLTVAAGEYEDAIEQIEGLEAETPLEEDWLGYLTGMSRLARGDLDEAYEIFETVHDSVVSAPEARTEEDRFRIAARCLKKMGWYHRQEGDYERAYAYHSMEHQLAERFGSYDELQDAALSLDVDSYYLEMPQMSRRWLEESIEAAEQIERETYRVKSLGMCWNNLTGTLCELEAFEAAADAAETSLSYWSEYEELEGTEENRVVWANHILADAYKRWGDHLVEDEGAEEGRPKLHRAKEAAETALELAEEREMSEEDIEDIGGKLEDIDQSLEGI